MIKGSSYKPAAHIFKCVINFSAAWTIFIALEDPLATRRRHSRVKVQKAWRQSFYEFANREWVSILFWWAVSFSFFHLALKSVLRRRHHLRVLTERKQNRSKLLHSQGHNMSRRNLVPDGSSLTSHREHGK